MQDLIQSVKRVAILPGLDCPLECKEGILNYIFALSLRDKKALLIEDLFPKEILQELSLIPGVTQTIVLYSRNSPPTQDSFTRRIIPSSVSAIETFEGMDLLGKLPSREILRNYAALTLAISNDCDFMLYFPDSIGMGFLASTYVVTRKQVHTRVFLLHDRFILNSLLTL